MIDASDDSPAYVAGLEQTGSTVYRTSSLPATTLGDDNDIEAVSKEADVAETEIVNEDVDGLDDLPEGWGS